MRLKRLHTARHRQLALRFEGLGQTILMDGADDLLPVLGAVMPHWRFEVLEEAREADACIRITGAGANRYLVHDLHGSEPAHEWDAVDAVCDVIADLALERVRASDSLFCLHGAAVAFAGRLVIFPNDHRAGKSVLTAVLGHAGHCVFGDDVLPITIAADGTVEGIATGVLPRVRLPVPAGFSSAFRDWAADNPGPGNDRYKYLDIPDLAAHGTRLPIGAIVRLDRREGEPPQLGPLSRAEAFECVIDRNFARNLHSGRIMRAFEALARQVPLATLTYGSAEEAAALLAQEFPRWNRPAPRVAAPLDVSGDAPAVDEANRVYHPERRYVRAEGLTETTIDGLHYVADSDGRGLFRLNHGARVIWAVLEEPATGPEAADIVATAFPAEDPARIAEDCARTFAELLGEALIVPAP